MAYEENGYILHQHKKRPNLRYFAKKGNKKGKPIDLPKGYDTKVNKKTGLPILFKKKSKK